MRGPGSTARHSLAVLLLALAATVTHAASLAGQPAPELPIVDLTPWADAIWLSLTDRDGSWYGRLAEEGIFQRFNPRMDHEYELDIRSGLFDPAQDARWAEVQRGLRVAGASISHPHILGVIQWRERIPVTDGVALLARYHRERSLTARRDYPWLGLAWRDAGGSGWSLWSGLGVHFFKPSADVEVGAARSWRRRGREAWRLEVRVAALDAFNDLIFGGLGVDDDAVDAHLDYRTPPVAARVRVRGTMAGVDLQLHGGGSNRSEVEVTFPESGDPPYRQVEQVGFVGASLDVRPSSGVAAGVFATLARARIERRSAPPGDFGFTLREQTERVGARGEMRLPAPWTASADVEWLWRPEDRSPLEERAPAPSERVRHRDRQAFGRVALQRRPSTGWTARLAYEVLDRNAGMLVPALTATNQRLTTEGGHRFASSLEVVVGLRWDLDHFTDEPFDGGHVRLSARW